MENPCSNCDSTSMEMCLLIRHCEHFVTKKPKEESRCREYWSFMRMKYQKGYHMIRKIWSCLEKYQQE